MGKERDNYGFLCGLLFCEMKIAIWLDDAGFWKGLGKRLQ
jgi:hypothetical protein